MVNINFYNIRSFKGSQQEGFEEFICQLAHLSPPENAIYFVRKDGAGGDGGVECYWKLSNGSEHGWQAKYFIDVLDDNQWSQIDKSVITALDKHPSLEKYYVCLPRDWNDSRKVINGNPVNTSWDKWCSHVKKWKELAQQKGITVEFESWCKHDMITKLTSEDPKFSGRALYWFNEPVISHSDLYKIANISKESLGERFTPEFHLDLPIAKKFEGIGLTKKWIKEISGIKDLLLEAFATYTKEIIRSNTNLLTEDEWKQLSDAILNACKKITASIDQNSFINDAKFVDLQLSDVLKKIDLCENVIYKRKEQDKENVEKYNRVNTNLYKISREIKQIKSFLVGSEIRAAKTRAMVVLGEAGIGKSHLLCDLSLKRLEDKLPTLFILGQHYEGGNPIDFILKSLDLVAYTRKQVLGALDAAGEAHGCRTLIIIDAINEGQYKEQWHDNLVSMISEISSFENLALVFSCRSTFKDYLIPEGLDREKLIRVEHHGFSGFEHRAASIYLSKQGISKPSTPIVSPEFSNPLFLKTCCKALKANDLDSFPKGLNGISALFDFYIQSVSKVIDRKKKYLPGESVVADALKSFIKALYPDNLYGLPVKEARIIIDNHDSKKNIGDSLIDLLIDEGVLSLDIAPDPNGGKRGIEVVRFTYERFSDHFLALLLIDKYTENNQITKLFAQGEFIDLLITDNNVYGFGGVFEALGVIIPEKFNKEFMEFIPESFGYYEYFFERTFSDAVVWRSPSSFSKKTLELLNKMPKNYRDERIKILLSFSTEPDHPWNADFLDKNLKNKKLAERDAFWSIEIAISDQQEDDDQSESVLRTIIDWAMFTDLSTVDDERLRLSALTLIWMTTTSNRKVRDQATKSLVRIFVVKPNLISDFLYQFNKIDDLYLLERLYAASYGAATYLSEETILKKISLSVYEIVFENSEPYPDILLRDYARGILEYVKFRGFLHEKIEVNLFTPPYKSKWPIENPTIEELEKRYGDNFATSIKSSIMGFPGDFGNYSMRDVHNWSPTPLSEPHPETAIELHQKFAENLSGELKKQYLLLLEKKKEENSRDRHFDYEKILKEMSTEELETIAAELEEDDSEITWDEFKGKVEESLDNRQKEEFRWISGLGFGNRPSALSRKWAQRWVCSRAFDLGWKKELFEDFERTYCHSDRGSENRIERIGKKYQWIAYRELLARISDNVHWIDRGYSDVDDSMFVGPWQFHEREIDPTMLIRKTGDGGWNKWDEEFWWRPFVFRFSGTHLEEQKVWLWDRSNIPPFVDLVKVNSSNDNKEWLVLHGFSSWRKELGKNFDEDSNESAEQDAWFRINSIIVKKEDVQKVKDKIVNNEQLRDPHTVDPSSTGHQAYYREFPWHPSCRDIYDWIENEEGDWSKFGVKYLKPVSQYEWEKGSLDNSIEEGIYFYLPSKALVEQLSITADEELIGHWKNKEGEDIFIDPSVNNKGPSYGLVRKGILENWLRENDLQIIWLIGGEKQLFGKDHNKFFGRLVFNLFITFNNNTLESNVWFVEEPPREKK